MSGSTALTGQTDFLRALAFTLGEEGGLTDDPNDPGGITNLGMTIPTWSTWLGRTASADDIRALTVDQVVPAYHALFWNAVRGWGLPAGVGLSVFDHAVNAGPRDSAVVLQLLVAHMQTLIQPLEIDGQIGGLTLSATRAVGAARLLPGLRDAQLSDYGTKSDWPIYRRDWSGRVARRFAAAALLAGIGSAPTTSTVGVVA